MLYFLIAFVAFLISAHLVKDERQATICIVCALLNFSMLIYTLTR
jgi:hypothetical protein